MKLSIIVPVYNEKDTIRQSIQGVLDVDLGTVAREIIVVDDRSTDETVAMVKAFGDAILLVEQTRNAGKGAAIRAGLELATGDIVLIHDADLEYSPTDIPALIQPIVDGKYKAAFGTRFALGAKPNGMKPANLLANKILALGATILFGRKITDEATCYKAVQTELLRSMNLRATRFEFCPEVTAKLMRAGHRIAEVPVQYHARTVAEGKKIHWYDGLEALWTLVKYRFVK
jgi:glycosyltransferase involved in cell wall biosynthesis